MPNTIRISHAGYCPRRLLLEAKGVEGLPPWEGTARAFAEGILHEPSILEWAAANLPGGPYVLRYRQIEIAIRLGGGKLLSGHPDGFAAPDEYAPPKGVVEAKCLSAHAFQELRDKGVKATQPQYFTQVELYCDAWNGDHPDQPVAGGWLVARNKETPRTRMWDHHYEWIEYDPAFCAKEVERLRQLRDLMDAGGDMEPPYNPKDSWTCRVPWCPYAYHCHPNYVRHEAQAIRKDDLAPSVARYMELGEEICALESERNGLKANLIATLDDKPILAGAWQVYWHTQRRESFDTRLARKELSPDVLARLLRVTEFKQLKVEEAL